MKSTRTLQCRVVSRSALPLIVLALFTFFVGLGRGAITDSDEAFYAEAAREMVERGDWLTPSFNYEPRFQKPVLYYWLTAATYLLTGPSELAARWWSACSGVGLVLVTAACGRRWYNEETGLLAGAIAATTFGYFALAHMALPDLPLTFFITLAIFASCMATLERSRSPRGWVLVTGMALGLGVLTKGPVALVLPALVVIPLIMIERRRLEVGIGDVLPGLAVLLLIAVPWYVAMWWEHGTGYLQGFFIGDNVERFATSRFNEPRPWWFYAPVLAGGLLPWTPLMLVWVGPVRGFLARRRDFTTLDLRLLLWAVLPLLFYTVSVGKQPRYILPVLPPLAILLAGSILERTRSWRGVDGAFRRRRVDATLVTGTIGSGLILVAIGVLLYRLQILAAPPTLLEGNRTWIVELMPALLVVLAGATVILVSVSAAWRTAPATLVLASAVALLSVRWSLVSQPATSAVQDMALLVTQARTGQEDVASYEVFVRNLGFYTRVPQAPIFSDEQMHDFLQRDRRVLAVLPASALARIEGTYDVHPVRLGEVAYVDSSAIRLGSLMSPDLAVVERVLLVSNRERR